MRDDSVRWLTAGDPQAHAASLSTRFAEVFRRRAHGVWFAPGRANLNGEHIDFHGGRCLPMALEHGTYAAAAPRTDNRLRLRTLDPDLDTGILEAAVDDTTQDFTAGLDGAPGWVAYVWGVLWAMRRLREEHPELALDQGFGADVLIRSTLPIGAGLSSSASLECAAALAFTALGTPVGRASPGTSLTSGLSDEQRAVLARACVRAEVEVVGAGTGGLDQNTSLRAAEGNLLSLDCRDFSLTHTDTSSLLRDHRFLAVDTGQPHVLATSDFTARRAESEAAASVLGVRRLRDALPEHPSAPDVARVLEKYDAAANAATLGGADPQACRRRLVHALNEMLRSEALHGLLTEGRSTVQETVEVVGRTMTAGHASMRDDAEVSFTLADRVVETVLAHGAAGARLIGGGFGGSILMLLPREALEELVAVTSRLSPAIRFLDVKPSSAAAAL